MSDYLALIVDDEPDICELLELTLGRMDINVHAAGNMETARQLLRDNSYDLCLTDMRLPDGNGIELIKDIHHCCPNTPIAMITAHGNMESAIQALKAGAFDFVSKPIELSVLRSLVTTALKLKSKSNTETSTAENEKKLLGNSPAIEKIRQKINKLARSQAPVYISGESGTGKELVAKRIHELGARSDKPFIPVNCGAIPENLVESEFFGHSKGSFTGATTDKQGLFQAADGGTLFLDEVADLPLAMQVKLLRAIQEKAIRPVGSSLESPIDVRILCATHKNLAHLVEQGEFRQDLYYRINVIELNLPSLRDRKSDIPLLAEHILKKLAQASQIQPPVLNEKANHALIHYHFPGNIRELENILERAITLCDGNVIEEDDLHLSQEPIPEQDKPIAELDNYLDNKEKEAIVKALEQTRHNKTAAAKLLGISFRALRYRLKKLGMD